MYVPIRYAEKALSIAANGAWQVFSLAERDRTERLVHPEVV